MRSEVLAYVAGTSAVALGLALATFGPLDALAQPGHWGLLLLLLALCVAAEFVSFQLHSGWVTASGTVPHVATALLLSPGLGGLVAALAFTAYGMRRGMPPSKRLFNAASVSLAVTCAGLAARQLGGPALLAPEAGIRGLLGAVAVTAVYYTVSALTVAGVVALDQRRSLRTVLQGKLQLNLVVELGFGLLGALLAYVVVTAPHWTIALLVPGALVYLAKRALDGAERRSQHLQVTSAVSRTVARSARPEEAFSAIVDRPSRDVLRLEGLAVVPLGDTPQLEAQVAADTDQPLLRNALQRRVAETGSNVLVQVGEAAAADWLPSELRATHMAAIAIPFGAGRGEPAVGALLAWRGTHTARPASFDDAEVLVLETLADAAAVALESDRLIREAGKAEALREIAQLKDEFLGQVAHELRTPLSIIFGYSELILANGKRRISDGEQLQNAVSEIHRNSAAMTRLVEDLLDTARVQSGQLTLRLEDLPLRPWLERTVRSFGEVSRSHTVHLDLSPDLPQVHVDPVRLGQVLHNLLSNAARYSEPGTPIQVTAHVRPEDGQVEIRVEDRGAGIPPEEQERIFEKFFRGQYASRAVLKGAGLGLSVARALVKAQGGTIGLESTVGVGTTFWIRFPAVGVPALAASQPSTA